MIKSIVILGPAHPLRGGGITTFNERLATALQEEGYEVTIYSFSLQYPGILFPGRSQFTTEPPPRHLHIRSVINSINPLNWIRTGMQLRRLQPDLVLVRYWLPFMGASLGTILRLLKKNGHTRVIGITDNVIPHEKRPGDRTLTRYFLGPCDAIVTMSSKVKADLHRIAPEKKAIQVAHPLYDNFGSPVTKAAARQALALPPDDPILLFFGFIRKYKGLDILLEAMAILKKTNPAVKLVIAGEFYGDEQPYRQQVAALGIAGALFLHTHFIEDKDVKNYFCAADGVIQPYRNATQSGVTPVAYHFEVPMIVTNVGALPQYVPDGIAGIVTSPDPAAMASAIDRFFKLGKAGFLPGLREEKKKYLWTGFTREIISLAESLP